MNRRAISRAGVVCLLSTLVLAFAGVAAAAPVIDQEQPVINTTGFKFVIGAASGQRLAQVFTAGATGLLTEVRLSGACDTTLTVEVQAVTDGVPNGTVLTTETVDFSGSLPTTFRTISFSTPVPVTAGEQYALVLSTPGSCEFWPGPAGNPYTGGDAYFDVAPNPPDTWLRLGEFADLPFQTLVDATPADTTPPEAQCVSRDNGARFQLLASDDVAIASIVVADSGSDFVSQPFSTGDVVKITQAPGAIPSETRPGPGTTVSYLKLTGDAVLRVTDTSGNVTEVFCEVPPRSK